MLWQRVLLAAFLCVVGTQAPSFWHGNSASVYNGIIATRGVVNQIHDPPIDTTNKQVMVRSAHYARSTITSLRILAQNFYVGTNGVELGLGASATITASVEYPSGTCTQLKWSTLSSGTILDATTLLSDASVIAIPNGAQFFIRQFQTNPNGALYYDSATAATITGDQFKTAVSGLTDQTMSCDTITGGNTGMMWPLAVIGPTQAPTICIVGDSVGFGLLGNASAQGDRGLVAPTIGPLFGYTNLSLPGQRATTYVANSVQQRTTYQYCSHGIVQLGLNDLADLYNTVPVGTQNTVANLEARLTPVYAQFPGTTKVLQTTLSPGTLTSDNCMTLGGQTLTPIEPQRTGLNDALRSASYGPNGGFLEVSTALETSFNSGFWKTTPQFWSPDCSHLTTYGFAQIPILGTIDTSKIHRPFRVAANDNRRRRRRVRRAA